MQHVNIRRLKKFARNQLDAQSCLRELILAEEEDRLHPLEFVGKIKPWLRALDKELAKGAAQEEVKK
jgi:hypothetical protein